MKKVTIITGHYGSGKTNVSINLALELAKNNQKVNILDLDLVNPYFRTADFPELFQENNVNLIKPRYANTNLDIPSAGFDLQALILEDSYLIIDVGGDDAGAVALGQYHHVFTKYAELIDMFYVVNRYRYFDDDIEEAVELFYEIEMSARFSHTGIINNSNYGCETTAQIIQSSKKFAENVANRIGIPLVFSTAPRNLFQKLNNAQLDGEYKYVDIYVKQAW